MLSDAAFDADRSSVGLEVELNLTDDDALPAMANAAVLERIADADFQTELAQFNVEINVAPRRLVGGVLRELEDAMRETLNHAEERSRTRSEEHTSELQSRQYLVCRLLLEK